MKRALLLLIVMMSYPVFGQGPVSPCYWSGSVTKCFPSTGIRLSAGQALQLGDYVSGLVSVQAASPSSVYTIVLPASQGAATTIPQNDGSGNLTWVAKPSAPAIGGAITGASAGSVLFATPAAVFAQSANLTFDGNDLGIGTAPSAAATVVIKGSSNLNTLTVLPVTANNANGVEIRGINDNDSAIFLNNSGASGHLWDVRSNHNGFFEWIDGTQGLQRMVLATNGGLGLGTQTPQSLLDVRGSAAIGTYAGVTAAPSNGLIVSGSVGVGITGPAVYAGYGNLAVNGSTGGNFDFLTATSLDAEIAGTASSLILVTNIATPMIFQTNNSERMRILSGGNVGVGTSSPTSLFSVASGSPFQIDSNGNILKLNGVTQGWPSSQGGATTLLQNDGSGNLSWVATPTGATYPIPVASVSGVIATASLSGVVAVGNGGTGLATFSTGGVVIGAGTSAVTTASGAGSSVLRIPDTGGAPTFGSINLASAAAVTGKLPPANGGTGLATITSGGVMLGAGTGNVTTISGSATQVLVGGGNGVVAFGAVPSGALPAATAGGTIGGYTPGATAGYTGGSAIASGNVGQVILNNPGSAVTPNSSLGFVQVASGAATAGVWLISGNCALTVGSITAPTQMICAISTNASGNPDAFGSNNIAVGNPVGNTGSELWTPCGPRYVILNSSATYYLSCRVDYTTLGTAKWATDSSLQLVRIH